MYVSLSFCVSHSVFLLLSVDVFSLSVYVSLSVCAYLYVVCSLFHSWCLSLVCVFPNVCLCLSVSLSVHR